MTAISKTLSGPSILYRRVWYEDQIVAWQSAVEIQPEPGTGAPGSLGLDRCYTLGHC
jgi:hypothetical protein